MLAFDYIRASTLDEVKQGSNERQKEEILRYAQSKGYDIEFFENKSRARKGLNSKECSNPLTGNRSS